MAAKGATSSKKKTAAAGLKSPKTPKADKIKAASQKLAKKEDDRLKTGLNEGLVQKATEALLKYHEKLSSTKKDLLGSDQQIQVQFSLLRTPQASSKKPIRVIIPHPLFQMKNNENDSLEEPEVCLIVKEESKPWCKEMIERFPEEMGCIKKVLGLQSLRTKHARYEQRRALLHKYNVFMADDRILPMLSKALGSDFYKAKKLPIPITLTRKEALPFTIQRALNATYFSISKGTCITIRAGTTSMTCQQLTENILEIAKGSVPHMPLKWANIQNIAIKTPESVALPIYNKTPEVLREIAAAAGVDKDAAKAEIDTPEKEPEETPLSSKESPKSDKKRDLKSPLLRALKKQKQEETKTKKPAKEETPKDKKKGPSSKSDADTPAKTLESVKDDNKPTPKSNKKSDTPAVVATKSSSNEEAAKFISAKKFNGSKKGYVFRMGKDGLGYYVDVKPKVDHMAMEALMRAGKNKKGRDAPNNKGRKGRKSW